MGFLGTRKAAAATVPRGASSSPAEVAEAGGAGCQAGEKNIYILIHGDLTTLPLL